MQSADPLVGQDGLLLRMMIAAPVLSGATELNDFIASLPLQLNTIFANEGCLVCRLSPRQLLCWRLLQHLWPMLQLSPLCTCCAQVWCHM